MKTYLIKSKETFVTVCFPAPGACNSTIHKYIAGHCDGKDEKSACQCMSATLATFYCLLKHLLSSSSKNMIQTGNATICGYTYSGDHFGMTIRCGSKVSSVGKVVMFIKYCLEKLPASGKIFKKFVGGGCDEENFAWCVSKISGGMKNADISLIKPGKELPAKITKKLKDLQDSISIESKSAGTKPSGEGAKPHAECCFKVKNAIERFLLTTYLASNGIPYHNEGDCVEVVIGNQKMDTIKNKLNDKDKIEKFITQKVVLEKRKDIIPEFILLQLASHGQILANEVDGVLKFNLDTACSVLEKLVK
jgi:hypothetical protein